MKKLWVFFVIVGLLIVAGVFAGRMYKEYQSNKMMMEWLSSAEVAPEDPYVSSANPEEGFGQLEDAFSDEIPAQPADDPRDRADTAGNTSNASAKAPQKAVQQTIIGVISIDKLKLRYPVVEGVKPENLRAGIGHIPGTAAIGQPGNNAMAGHRNYTFGKFFNRLDEVKVGDTIMLSTKSKDYRYTVYEKLVVLPDDVSVIKGSKDENIITLITCTPIYIATHRLIIHARLEDGTETKP